jgi:hypothetical protein
MKIQGVVEPEVAKVVTLDDTTLNLAVREETQILPYFRQERIRSKEWFNNSILQDIKTNLIFG